MIIFPSVRSDIILLFSRYYIKGIHKFFFFIFFFLIHQSTLINDIANVTILQYTHTGRYVISNKQFKKIIFHIIICT